MSCGGVSATKGQHYPVPRVWLASDEARIAHDLVLPAAVPRPVPFDFEAARGPWYWPRSKREVAVDYFRHLCRTEAGEWIFEKPENVEGLYFARPRGGGETEKYLSDAYSVEAPWAERVFIRLGDSLNASGELFIWPPHRNYKYLELPKFDVSWQKEIYKDHIKIIGKTRAQINLTENEHRKNERPVFFEVFGVDSVSSKYAYTWRGIVRPDDRKMRVSGSELIVYERERKKVIAIKRMFQNGGFGTSIEKVNWNLASNCFDEKSSNNGLYMPEFVQRVLIESTY